MRGDASSDGFWSFSLRLYARPEVPPACLALQDEGGADVNLVLFLLYLADRGRLLDATEIAGLERATRVWRVQVVEPLRNVRRVLKTDVDAFTQARTAAFRDEVKRIELGAEKLEQSTLEALAPATTAGAPAPSR
ncbi:MAG: TIGR02444 family protein, partial [Proteobacteria bacterium]|nr:TIGR02444 family protein [Burkholderiales bacterium]